MKCLTVHANHKEKQNYEIFPRASPRYGELQAPLIKCKQAAKNIEKKNANTIQKGEYSVGVKRITWLGQEGPQESCISFLIKEGTEKANQR